MVSRARFSPALARKWHLLLPFSVALSIYLWRVGSPAFWLDEAATANEVARSGRGLLEFLAERDAVLGPYYGLMHFWARFGDGEFWFRLPSVLAMAVAAALVAALARRWWGGYAGLAAGLLFAVIPVTSRYAQEARPYAIAVACALLAIWLLTHAVREPDRRRWWIGYAVAVTALGLTHLVALTTLVVHPLILGRRRVRRIWTTWLAIGLAVPVVLLVIALGQRDQVAWIGEPTADTLRQTYLEIAGGVSMLALLGVLAVLGLPGNRSWPVPVTWFLLPPLLLAAVGTVTPVFTARYLLVCTPALVLLAAAGLRTARWWQVVVVAVLALAVGWSQQTTIRQPDGHGPDARAAAGVIARQCDRPPAVREGPATLQALPYYLERAGCPVRWVSQQQDPVAEGVERIWLVRPDWAEPARLAGYREVGAMEVSGLRLTYWER